MYYAGYEKISRVAITFTKEELIFLKTKAERQTGRVVVTSFNNELRFALAREQGEGFRLKKEQQDGSSTIDIHEGPWKVLGMALIPSGKIELTHEKALIHNSPTIVVRKDRVKAGPPLKQRRSRPSSPLYSPSKHPPGPCLVISGEAAAEGELQAALELVRTALSKVKGAELFLGPEGTLRARVVTTRIL
jgi:hypothetical protein